MGAWQRHKIGVHALFSGSSARDYYYFAFPNRVMSELLIRSNRTLEMYLRFQRFLHQFGVLHIPALHLQF
jgi:hypothetical protein